MAPWLDDVLEERARLHDAGMISDDVFTVLTRAEQEEDRLSSDEMRVFVFTLLVAGSFTTAFLLGNGVVELLDDPGLLDRLADDPILSRGSWRR